jgi:hypothetical protein
VGARFVAESGDAGEVRCQRLSHRCRLHERGLSCIRVPPVLRDVERRKVLGVPQARGEHDRQPNGQRLHGHVSPGEERHEPVQHDVLSRHRAAPRRVGLRQDVHPVSRCQRRSPEPRRQPPPQRHRRAPAHVHRVPRRHVCQSPVRRARDSKHGLRQVPQRDEPAQLRRVPRRQSRFGRPADLLLELALLRAIPRTSRRSARAPSATPIRRASTTAQPR